jgi:hypothetical protein
VEHAAQGQKRHQHQLERLLVESPRVLDAELPDHPLVKQRQEWLDLAQKMRLDRVVDARTGARYLPQTQTLRATSIQLVVVRGSGGDARGGPEKAS